MKHCPSCGATYEDSKKFCRVDGTVLVSNDEVSPPPPPRPAPPPEQHKSELPSRWSAAAAGGVTTETAPPPPPPPPPSKWSATPPGDDASDPADARRQRGGGKIIAAISIGTLCLAALGAVWWYWANPLVTVNNRLVAPVTVTIGGMLPLALGPGESATLRVGRGAAAAARWQMQPTAPVGRVPASGVELSGTAALTLPGAPFAKGTLGVGLLMPVLTHFAPVITNSTRGPICVKVNAAPVRAPNAATDPVDCDAILPPGAVDAFIGYFPLNAGSSVRAVDDQGRGTTFAGIARFVAPVSGRLPVSFDPSHFGGR